jgi:hypothetical protein
MMISQRACFDTHQAAIMLIMHDSTPCIRTEKPYQVTQISHLSSLHKCRQRQSMWPYIILHSEGFLWND